jgi:hypothetical protein
MNVQAWHLVRVCKGKRIGGDDAQLLQDLQSSTHDANC